MPTLSPVPGSSLSLWDTDIETHLGMLSFESNPPNPPAAHEAPPVQIEATHIAPLPATEALPPSAEQRNPQPQGSSPLRDGQTLADLEAEAERDEQERRRAVEAHVHMNPVTHENEIQFASADGRERALRKFYLDTLLRPNGFESLELPLLPPHEYEQHQSVYQRLKDRLLAWDFQLRPFKETFHTYCRQHHLKPPVEPVFESLRDKIVWTCWNKLTETLSFPPLPPYEDPEMAEVELDVYYAHVLNIIMYVELLCFPITGPAPVILRCQRPTLT